MVNKVELKNIYKKFDTFTLDGLSFSVPKGFITGFIGRNGAGKTTTIKSILSLINHHSGEILFDEKKVVYGRYITAIMIVLVNAILGSILFVAISLMIKSDELLMSLSINFLTTSFISIFIIILQYPSYFKYGYTKAKTMVAMPFLIMGILIFIGVSFKKIFFFIGESF